MHLGLIMDGNGRWAKKRGLPRAAGHIEGMKACKRVILGARNLGVDFVSFYVFSTENWKRPAQEVSYLMSLLAKKLPGETDWYKENNVRIRVRGNVDGLPEEARNAVKNTVEATSGCNGITAVLCVNYGGQDEISRAVNRFIEKNPGKKITVADIEANLDCPDIPAPDMIARSAGELRLSNFMLWDSAYAELLSIDKLWPDWDQEEVQTCLDALAGRTRKFGGLAQ